MIFKIKEFFCDLTRLIIFILIFITIVFISKINADIGLFFSYYIEGRYDFILLIKSFIVYLTVIIVLYISEFFIFFSFYKTTKKVKSIESIYNRIFNFMSLF